MLRQTTNNRITSLGRPIVSSSNPEVLDLVLGARDHLRLVHVVRVTCDLCVFDPWHAGGITMKNPSVRERYVIVWKWCSLGSDHCVRGVVKLSL